MKKVIVAGAGSSGLIAAIASARAGAAVTVLEHMNKPGKKLLLTGSGKCNLTTLDPAYATRYQSGGQSSDTAHFVSTVFAKHGPKDTIALFEEIGLITRSKGAYVYPASEQSASVLTVLMNEAQRLGVKFKYNTHINSLHYHKDTRTWEVKVDGWQYTCDSVILCCGSMAAPATGSDGSGYKIASALKETVVDAQPALTACISKDADLVLSAGARTHASVTLHTDHYVSETQTGELQWNKDGLSGIAVFQLSGRAGRYLQKGESVSLWVDFMPEMTEEALLSFLNSQQERNPKISPADLMTGLLPDRIIKYICKKKKLKNAAVTSQLASILKSFKIPICGLRDYTQSQTCSGGVAIENIDPETMESRRLRGLYYAGELIDVDGPCGGYNLQWAFSSGFVAGTHAAK